jgi:acyl dehydratase
VIDRRHIGARLTPYSLAAEPGRLRFFAKATGQQDPVYCDEAAAREAGFAGLPLPPTFLFSMELDAPDPAETGRLLGYLSKRVLHGEQHFTYHRVACAGEPLRFESFISDIYDKKNGALEFIVRDTRVTDAAGEPVADLRRVIVVCND